MNKAHFLTDIDAGVDTGMDTRNNNSEDSRSSSSDVRNRLNPKHNHNHLHYRQCTYWHTRVIFLRSLAFIQLVAFMVAFNQNEYLLGEHGLTPAIPHLQRWEHSILTQYHINDNGNWSSFDRWFALNRVHPTLFWNIEPTAWNMNIVSAVGCALALFVFLLGRSNVFIQVALWLLYMSIVNIGQTWYVNVYLITATYDNVKLLSWD
jgi:hypothetical protein